MVTVKHAIRAGAIVGSIVTLGLVSSLEVGFGVGNPESLLQLSEEAAFAVYGVVLTPETGEPRPNVSVRLQHRGEVVFTETDDRGRFRFGGLAPGRPSVSLPFPGDPETMQRIARQIEIGPTNPEAEVTLWQAPLQSISGRITSSDGTPVANAYLQLMRPTYEVGKRILVNVLEMSFPFPITDEDGLFRVTAPAGDYYLKVHFGAQNPELPAWYYPGSLSPEEAVEISLPSGVDLAAVDMTLRPAELFRIRLSLEQLIAAGVRTLQLEGEETQPISAYYARRDQQMKMFRKGRVRLSD